MRTIKPYCPFPQINYNFPTMLSVFPNVSGHHSDYTNFPKTDFLKTHSHRNNIINLEFHIWWQNVPAPLFFQCNTDMMCSLNKQINVSIPNKSFKRMSNSNDKPRADNTLPLPKTIVIFSPLRSSRTFFPFTCSSNWHHGLHIHWPLTFCATLCQSLW